VKNFKLYEEFLNESAWYPTFKAQGECINAKDRVTLQELEQIAYYFKNIFLMRDVRVGKIKIAPPNVSSYSAGETVEKYGVTGKGTTNLYEEVFSYYWKDGDSEIERGWVGKMITKGSSPGQFMSPIQFLECVEMHHLYSFAWIESTSKSHLSTMSSQMEKIALQGPRRGTITSKKYGL
jgi:hypothetical protein